LQGEQTREKACRGYPDDFASVLLGAHFLGSLKLGDQAGGPVAEPPCYHRGRGLFRRNAPAGPGLWRESNPRKSNSVSKSVLGGANPVRGSGAPGPV